ncbi:MAG TPA: hypothetical protein PKJ41_02475 [Bryobacteraceae bacterium]|nr:hypothetical protein [Bryobacteraceae bacterium]HPT28386.1 hypothetical protein [Bryobacteraceae bacterium]
MKTRIHRSLISLLVCLPGLAPAAIAPQSGLDLSRATVVIRSGDRTEPERAAATALVEEVERRTGIRLSVASTFNPGGPSIAVSTFDGAPRQGGEEFPAPAPEGYLLRTATSGAQPVVYILGGGPRAVMYGVGAFLRMADWAKGKLSIAGGVSIASAPNSPIRGHQIGYRSTANSWDAWTMEQFDQYFREFALFGVNAIENIPFENPRDNPLMKLHPREANRAISSLCRRYGMDYWVWTPASIDLEDKAKRDALLARFDELFDDSVTLTGVFVPGGDPGHNHPSLVLPLLEDIAKRMAPKHPKAKVWLSMQGFNAEREEYVYRYIEQHQPAWLGGLVAGPQSPPITRHRQRLPARYQLRLYPDLTHNKICQYQVPNWDQAYALTLGREAPNPRPAEYAAIHNRYASATDGFISYSDGVHDDVNKIIWSALAWDSNQPVREILIGYARFHFSVARAGEIADAILALERNWDGPLVNNGSVEATLMMWDKLDAQLPELSGNWRWQLCLLRAAYDPYVRRRLIHESGLEREANLALAQAPMIGSEPAIRLARDVLNRATTEQAGRDLRARIIALCERLNQSIGLQSSVEKYHASGAERGAVLDFVDTPLNNRWWLEDEFNKVAAMAPEAEKVKRLIELGRWSTPGKGSYYDDIGNIANSPHVEGDAEIDPETLRGAEPLFWWWDNGRSRARLSWQVTMWPRRVVYEGLDPEAAYVVRTAGQGQCLLSADGQRLRALVDGEKMGEFKEFAVPAELLRDRRLVLTFEIPSGEENLNWRQRSRLSEVWLLRRE